MTLGGNVLALGATCCPWGQIGDPGGRPDGLGVRLMTLGGQHVGFGGNMLALGSI